MKLMRNGAYALFTFAALCGAHAAQAVPTPMPVGLPPQVKECDASFNPMPMPGGGVNVGSMGACYITYNYCQPTSKITVPSKIVGPYLTTAKGCATLAATCPGTPAVGIVPCK